jgi:hypothetical protein
MEIGRHGVHGILVLTLVEVEHKPKAEHAPILHHSMEVLDVLGIHLISKYATPMFVQVSLI